MTQVTAAIGSSGPVTVMLDGDTAGITAGGSGVAGSMAILDGSGNSRVQILSGDPSAGPHAPPPHKGGGPFPPAPAKNVLIDGNAGALYLSDGAALSATVVVSGSASWVRLSAGKRQIHLDGAKSAASLSDDNGTQRVSFDGQAAVLRLANDKGADRFVCNGQTGVLGIRSDQGKNRFVLNSETGVLQLTDDKGMDRVVLDSGTGVLQLADDQGKNRVVLNPELAYGAFGGFGHDGGLAVFPAAATDLYAWAQATFTLSAQAAATTVKIGGSGSNGQLFVVNDKNATVVTLDGKTADLMLYNADCAEEFDLAEAQPVEPGTIVVLDEHGRLRESAVEYDRKVAGVVSGAGGYRPGIVLDRRPTGRERATVALMGKAYCKVDADYAPIAVGDLLTTSATAGHAMKATDSSRAFGAVIGKALQPLSCGRDLIPILVVLQ